MQESQYSKSGTNVKKGSNLSLKQFDLFQKIDENFQIQTTGGAILSIIGWVIIAILVFAEIRNYHAPLYNEHMVVDTSLGQMLPISIDITFHSLTCNDVHLDVMDIAGDNQLNVEHDMAKQRLTPTGEKIGRAGLEIIGEGNVEIQVLPPNYCGSCYGAETEFRKCCNTCDDLVKAYQDRDWSISGILRNSTQCIQDRARHFAAVKEGEGCRVTGQMKVNKVSGNFHIAHGESVVRDGRHIHHFNPSEAPKFNVSHTIHSISFGTPYPYQKNPLDSMQKLIKNEESTGLFQYYIRVIPTLYTDSFGRQISTSQYTVTDKFRPFIMPPTDGSIPKGGLVLPGIFFVFEISPFMIEAKSSQVPFLHLITKLMAIVGGILTVLAVIDHAIYLVQSYLKK